MTADNGMLSQEEIDELFQKATGMVIHHKSTSLSGAESKTVSAPAPQPVAGKSQMNVVNETPADTKRPPVQSSSQSVSVIPPPVAVVRNAAATQSATPMVSKTALDNVLRQFQMTTNALIKRIIEAENKITQLEQQNRALSSKLNTTSNANVTAIVKEVKRIRGQVKTISSNLEATPGYNAHNNFVCTSCGSKGKVAVPMRCTECGQEGWKGWFRRK